MVFKKKQPKTEGVVVGGKKKLQLPDVKKLKNIDWRSRKTKLLLVLAGLIIILIPIGLYAYGELINTRNTKTTAQVDVCRSDSSLISETAAARDSRDVEKIKEIFNTVKSKPNYSNDQNCIYSMLVYHLMIGDATNARLDYNLFTQIYEPQRDAYLQSNLRYQNEGLNKQVEFLESKQSEMIENAKVRGQYVED